MVMTVIAQRKKTEERRTEPRMKKTRKDDAIFFKRNILLYDTNILAWRALSKREF